MAKQALSLLILVVLSTGLFAQELTVPKKTARTIREKNLQTTMAVLVADSLEGRATGKPGAEKAASYIESYFALNGLKPLTGSYRQSFDLWGSKYGNAQLRVNNFTISGNDQLFYMSRVPQNDFSSREMVFVGTAADSVIAQMDLTGKVALVLLDDINRRLSVTGRLREKGAWAVIGINPNDDGQFATTRNNLLEMRHHMQLSPNKPLLKDEGERYLIMSNQQVPLLFGVSAKELITLGQMMNPATPINASISIRFPIEVERVEAFNVIGVIKGTDPSSKPVAVTAHYDHVGIQPDGSVCLGADDNASGVSTMMEMAATFAHMKKQPKRDIYFIAFTAEELGLFGSAHFMKDKGRDDFFANVNIDMIGRHDTLTKDNYVYILGTENNPWAQRLHQRANAQTEKLTLDYYYNHSAGIGSFMNRSDHYHFYKNNIPVISFFSGLHGDYHTPFDTMDRIDFPLMAKRARVIFATIFLLANEDHRTEK